MRSLMAAFSASIIFVFASLLAVHPALAQVSQTGRNLGVAAAQPNEQRVALVIGNAAYKESPLRNPVNDATDIAAALKALGFNVILRTNASRRQMVEAVRDFGNQIRRGGVGFFYYAGHGIQSRGKNFLIPVGAQLDGEADLEFESMDANMVQAQMDEAGNRVNIVVLDACRDNPFARSFRSASRGLAQMDSAKGSFLAYATSPGSVAADGSGRNGVYTKHLLDSLKQPDTRLEEVFKRVRVEVARETGNKQIPWDSSSVLGDFYFRPPSGGAPVASLAPSSAAAPADPTTNDRAFWESVKDSKNPEEFKAYLEQFPNGLFATLARTRVRALEQTQVATAAPAIAATRPAATPGSISAMTPGTVFRDCEGCPEMVVIPPGSFTMGSLASEQARDSDEGPQHQVRIARAFAAGKYEATRGEFARFVQEASYAGSSGCYTWDGKQWNNDTAKSWRNPGFDQTDRDPVACVNWQDAKAYTEWLSRKSGKTYRLLTEAEWEYAARADTTTVFSFGDRITPQSANYGSTASYAGSPTAVSAGKTRPVGSYPANAFGLYDVHGNVLEWTEDCYNANYNGAPSDGTAWSAGDCSRRVLRGGSWGVDPQNLRSANRNWDASSYRINYFGFRVSRTD